MHSHGIKADAEEGRVQVRTESEVIEVLLGGGRATGVWHLYATKMTLLCAGVYATPSLLAKSGLGPESRSRRRPITTQSYARASTRSAPRSGKVPTCKRC